MVQLTGQAGVIAAVAGQPVPLNVGASGELLTGAMNGFFYEQTMRGNGFIWSTAIAGVALVAPVATASATPTIVNPPGSNRLIVIEKVCYNRTALATPLEGGTLYCFHRAASVVAAAGDIVGTGTIVAGQNARLDLSNTDTSKVLWYPTGIVFTAIPTFLANAGTSQAASTGTTTGVQTFVNIDYVNGQIVCPPGFAFSIAANVALSTTYAISIYGLSIPVPSYFQ